VSARLAVGAALAGAAAGRCLARWATAAVTPKTGVEAAAFAVAAVEALFSVQDDSGGARAARPRGWMTRAAAARFEGELCKHGDLGEAVRSGGWVRTTATWSKVLRDMGAAPARPWWSVVVDASSRGHEMREAEFRVFVKVVEMAGRLRISSVTVIDI
jgi:hypothetical protein